MSIKNTGICEKSVRISWSHEDFTLPAGQPWDGNEDNGHKSSWGQDRQQWDYLREEEKEWKPNKIGVMAESIKVKVFSAKHENLWSSPKTHVIWKKTPTNYPLTYICTLRHAYGCTCTYTFNYFIDCWCKEKNYRALRKCRIPVKAPNTYIYF